MELTNHTYLRSRVDMQLADSMRLKASNKISAGVLGNARENAGGFSAGIRFKSNQYLLQSRRANIQNSLSYLDVQRDAIMEARDIMERIALTKVKFDAPTLNASDRRNLNIEFSELTDELISLRDKKFNGVSLFTPTLTSSSELFGSSRTSLETGSEANNGVGISQHVIDYQDVRNIYDAGDGVKRGKAGLNVINFEKDPVQRQIERVVIGGSIADGDVFSLKLNELSSIREVESTKTISVTADSTDEGNAVLQDPDGIPNSGDEFYDFTNSYISIRDKLIDEINNQAATGLNGQFVSASADGNNALIITSEGEGDPFDLFQVTSSSSVGSISKSSDTHEGTLDNTINAGLAGTDINRAEERTLTLDFRDDAALATGTVVNANDTLSVTLNGQLVTFTASAADMLRYENGPNGTAGGGDDVDLSDPLQYEDAALFMMMGLREEINKAANVNVIAELPAKSTGVGATMQIRSTIRGEEFQVTGNQNDALTISTNLTQGARPATGSTVTIEKTDRDPAAGDEIQILKNNSPVATFAQGAGGGGKIGFTDLDDLVVKINAFDSDNSDAVFDFTATKVGNIITIQDNYPDPINGQADPAGTTIRKQPEDQRLQIRQTQAIDSGALLSVTNTASTLANKEDWDNLATTGGAVGSSGLQIDLQVDNATGALSNITASALGSGYSNGDAVTVAGTTMDGDNGNDLTFSVVAENTAVSHTTGKPFDAAKTYNVTGLTGNAAGTGLDLNITANADGTITIADSFIDGVNNGTGFVDGEEVTVLAANLQHADLLGNNAEDLVLEVSTDGAGNVTGITQKIGNNGRAESAAGTYTKATSGGGGTGLELTFTLTDDGSISGGVTIDQRGTGNYIKNATVNVDGASFRIDAQTVTGVTYTGGDVKGVSGSGDLYQHQQTITGGDGNGVITFKTDRQGNVSDITISAAGRNYTESDTRNFAVAALTDPNSNWILRGATGVLTFTLADVEEQFTDAESDNFTSGGNSTQNNQLGHQYVPTGTNGDLSDSLNVANNSNRPGAERVIEVTVGNDTGSGGQIAPGDTFTATVSEVRHSNESSGTGNEDAITFNPATLTSSPIGDNSFQNISTTGGGGSGLTLDISIQNGIATASVNTFGSGYEAGDSIQIDEGDIGGATGTLTNITIDEVIGEGARGAHTFSATVMAAPGDTADDIATALESALQAARNVYINGDAGATPPIAATPLANKDLPQVSASGNVITLEAAEDGSGNKISLGEDYDITLSYSSSIDSLSGTGNGSLTNDPEGKIIPSDVGQRQKNISPFSVTKSISYFEEMLAQNEAETSRLMKAMEHLEDSMIHNEDALSKVQDTDYSQASVEHMRNAVKVQMANNVMGKSMRMNDLLIDLTTKHYRGSMLNAKA